MFLTATGVGFGYAERPILEQVDVKIGVGEAVAIVGPSGVGKTTLLAVLGGMLPPQQGSVTIDGLGDVRDGVSWILQTVNALPNRTVIDNVTLGALSDGRSRADAMTEAETRLESVGLAGLTHAVARTLSGGELQRMVIARSLTSNRRFLLADEPTGQLDQATTQTVVECLLAARSERGIVIVTHDPQVAERCDRVYELNNGVLEPA